MRDFWQSKKHKDITDSVINKYDTTLQIPNT